MADLQIHTVMLPTTITHVVGNKDVMSHQPDSEKNRSTAGSYDSSMGDKNRFEENEPANRARGKQPQKHSGCPPAPRYISLDEYPNVSENIILDTRSGKTAELETGVKNGLLVTEPDGHSVYFMQMLCLRGQMILCFYDSGAPVSYTHLTLPTKA